MTERRTIRPYSAEDLRALQDMWCRGISPADIARRLGRSVASVSVRAKKLGLENMYLTRHRLGVKNRDYKPGTHA